MFPSKNYSLEIGSVRYDPVRLAFSPLGGSLVILTPFCRIAVGNLSEGYEVSQSLKSGLVIYGSGESYSQILSRIGIQVTAK